MKANPELWDLDDAREAVHVERKDQDWRDANRDYYDGDHWRDGRGWTGPWPERSDPAYTVAVDEIERGFTSRNVVAEVTESHADGVVGKEPRRGWEERKRRPKGEAAPQAVADLIAQAGELSAAWRELNGTDAGLWDAVVTLLLTERAPAYLYVPPGLLVPKRNAAGREYKELPPGDVQAMLSMIRIRFPDPQQCAIYTNPDTLQRVGVYRYDIQDPEHGKQARADLTYSAPDGLTVIRTVGEGIPETDKGTRWDFGGRLPMFEMRRPLFVTQQVRENQESLNLALSMVPHNLITGGFLYHILMNVEMPMREVVSADGTVEKVPAGVAIGPKRIVRFLGKELHDPETGEYKGRANPSYHRGEPVPIDSAVDGVAEHYRAILAEARQQHTLITAAGDASGVGLQQARNAFLGSLRRTAHAVNEFLVWQEETPLAMAEAFAAGARRKVPHVFTGPLKAFGTCKLDGGPPTPDEVRVALQAGDSGYAAPEDVLSAMGVDEPAEALERINAARQARGSKEEAELLKAYADAGLSMYAAARRIGLDEETARMMQQGDVPTGVEQ